MEGWKYAGNRHKEIVVVIEAEKERKIV